MTASTHNSTGKGAVGDACTVALKVLAGQIQDMIRRAELKLSCSSAGRIVLHLALALMTCRFAWHFHGIARELTRS